MDTSLDDATIVTANVSSSLPTNKTMLSVRITNNSGDEENLIIGGAKKRYQIGRHDPNCSGDSCNDIPLNDRYTSRKHCLLSYEQDRWYLEDLNSTNGTVLDGEPMREKHILRKQSSVNIGATSIHFSLVDAASADPSVRNLDKIERDSLPVTDSTADKYDIEEHTVIAADAIPQAADDDDDQTIVASNFSSESAPDTEKHHPPPGTSTPPPGTKAGNSDESQDESQNESQNAIDIEQMPTLLKELIKEELLSTRKAEALLKHTAMSQQTLFQTLIDDRSIRHIEKICKMVSERHNLPLIEDRQEIIDSAVETEWLNYSHSVDAGLILLQNSQGVIDRYLTNAPFDLLLKDWIHTATGQPPQPVLTTPEIFHSCLQQLKTDTGDSEDAELEAGVAIDIDEVAEQELKEQLDEIDIPQMVNYFIHRAATQGASDIHVEPAENMLLVRNRIDGILHEESSLPKEISTEITSRLKIMSDMDVAEKRRPQDGRFGRIITGRAIDVRVSSFPTVYGEKIVMRLLDKNALRPSIESLGLPHRDLRLLKDKIAAPYGLVMISGPTGSGKTTTLYSCLGGIDKETKNVLTVEDPVEYRLNGVHQMQVNSKIGLTFASGLRTILRQDPDVIMVGECRDTETTSMAIQASLTGHIVFSTIHTNDAVGVVTRMLDMGIEPFLVSTSLSVSIAQRLVRTICPHCKSEVSGEEILDQLMADGVSTERLEALELDIDPYLDYAQGVGCSHCRDTGYHGRQAVFEVFEMTNEARSMILSEDFNADNLRKMSKEMGMTTLIRHGLSLVEEEKTTFSEIIRVLGES